MRNFRSWDIYQDGMDFVKEVYLLTKALPKEEAYGLSSQIRRASVSIVTNIAEGAAKTSSKDFHRYLEISLGSAFEVETLVKIVQEMEYTDLEDLDGLLIKIESLEKRINAFIQKIRNEDLN
jgi:four helix bundle protein